MLRRLTFLILTCAAGAAIADDCAFRADREFTADAAGLAALKLSTGAGDLRIEGVSGLTRIEVHGKACAGTQALLDQIKFDGKREGNAEVIGTVLPDTNGTGWFGGDYAYLDVIVKVPKALALEVRDSSGDVDVNDVGSISLDDSSGDINIHQVQGDVRINDSSGDIIVEEVSGNVLIPHDSSGDIRIARVRGSAEVSEDSSGDIAFEHVDGAAKVGSDSSGSITFRYIGRDASVVEDSSGDIDADAIGGDFSVQRKSGGARNIHSSNVAGKTPLPTDG